MQITLRAARVNAGITQAEAGEIVGVGRDTIASWESERSFPDIISFKTLCEKYGVDMNSIIFMARKST